MYVLQPDRSPPKPRAGKAWIIALVALVLAGGGVALFFLLRNKDVDDLDLVPRDALGFVTVRVADALETEPVKKMKDSLLKMAGRDGQQFMQQLSAVEDEFGLKLSDVERVTVVVKEAPTNDRGPPVMWVVVRTKKDIDKDRILKFIKTVATYEEDKHEGQLFYAIGKGAVCFLSARVAVIAPSNGIKKAIDVAKNGPGKGPLEDAVKLANGTKYTAVAAANFGEIVKIPEAAKDLERSAKKAGPEGALAKMALSMKTVTYTVQVDKKLSVDVAAEFDNADSAKQAVAAIEQGLAMARQEIKPQDRQRPEIKPLLEMMDQIKPKASGSTVTISVEMDTDPLVSAILFGVGRGGMPDEPRQPVRPERPFQPQK